jgi:hypothetical protein
MAKNEMTLEESVVDSIFDWMDSHVYCDEDGVQVHNEQAARDELEAILIEYSEEFIANNLQDILIQHRGEGF